MVAKRNWARYLIIATYSTWNQPINAHVLFIWHWTALTQLSPPPQNIKHPQHPFNHQPLPQNRLQTLKNRPFCSSAVILVALPLFVWELIRRGATRHLIATVVAFVFAMLACSLSVHDIVQHLLQYRQPLLQQHVVRILWMVPVYAVESFLSLFFTDLALFFETVRDMFEAFVIYSFLQLLLNYAGSESRLADRLRHKPVAVGRHIPPCSWCLRDWRLGRDYVQRCKTGVLQYVVIKLACTLAVVLLEWRHLYDEGNFRPDRGYLWVTLISNFSQIWAIYCLVMFYQATKEELAGIRPLPKFLVIKAVVFLSWWQAVSITVLATLGYIRAGQGYSKQEVAKALQNFLICVEMFFAALAHRHIFSYKDFATTDEIVAEPAATASIAGSGGNSIGGSLGDTPVAATPVVEPERGRGFLSAFVESALPIDIVREVGTSVLRRNRQEDEEELLPHQAHTRSAHRGRRRDTGADGGRVRFAHKSGLSAGHIQMTATVINEQRMAHATLDDDDDDNPDSSSPTPKPQTTRTITAGIDNTATTTASSPGAPSSAVVNWPWRGTEAESWHSDGRAISPPSRKPKRSPTSGTMILPTRPTSIQK